MSSCPKVLLVPVARFSPFASAPCRACHGVRLPTPNKFRLSRRCCGRLILRLPDATAADLETRAEQLRASKLYLDALDYYRAALAKQPNSAALAEQDRHHRVDDAALSRGEEIV